MKIIKENSPHIHKASSVKRMMIDVLIALIPVTVFAIIQFKLQAVKVIGISVVTMVLAELVYCFIVNQDPYNGEKKTFKQKLKTCISKSSINNITAPLISGLIYALIMPNDVSWYIVLTGALFGIVIGKLVFGGLGGNIFNPAAVGRVFTMICFGASVKYSPVASLGATSDMFDTLAGGTALVAIENSAIITLDAIKNLFIGTIAGSMGEVSKICILVGAIYLIIRKSCDPRPMLSMILTFMVLMLFAGIGLGQDNIFMYMLYQTLSGGLLFGAVFMVTDPITSPTTRPGRITFGILVAIVAALIRCLGAYPEGVAFAILICNMFVPVIDYYKWSTNKYSWKHFVLWTCLIGITSLILVFAL